MLKIWQLIQNIWKAPASSTAGVAALPAGIETLLDGIASKDTGKIIMGVLALATTIAGLFYNPDNQANKPQN